MNDRQLNRNNIYLLTTNKVFLYKIRKYKN